MIYINENEWYFIVQELILICSYSVLIFFAARSFTSSRSSGSILTLSTTSLAARLGVESNIRKASLTAEVSTPILRLIPPCTAGA